MLELINLLSQTAGPIASGVVLAILLADKYKVKKNGDFKSCANAVEFERLKTRVDEHEKNLQTSGETSAILFEKLDSLGSQIANMRENIATLVERSARK